MKKGLQPDKSYLESPIHIRAVLLDAQDVIDLIVGNLQALCRNLEECKELDDITHRDIHYKIHLILACFGWVEQKFSKVNDYFDKIVFPEEKNNA